MTSVAQPKVHLWTRQEYHRMADLGLFEGRRVELVEGQVIDMAAMKSPHAVAIDLVDQALKAVFGAGYYIRQQKPLVISDISEPEPDVAVVPGTIRDYAETHPTTAVLIVEVADTSLSYDRNIKGSLYAKAGVADYWILNLVKRRLEVRRQPVADNQATYGWQYGESVLYDPGQQVSPLAAEGVWVTVEDLLP
ncbi:Uma2 family endonuclease [Synechococcales cyanobacterium C]|uniref:Uma2 family endonuclease n=1 Tax=Petrachloros mirabilis ULC683 TaxID=2781853 RepID=A0A8K2A1F2_9CYAN|nr:Uma2 family endonuclease [Petrachloros mirabilis]NCJ07886.1 Uma2 family endonuclease [Petrachloros mirabilis ULC683]